MGNDKVLNTISPVRNLFRKIKSLFTKKNKKDNIKEVNIKQLEKASKKSVKENAKEIADAGEIKINYPVKGTDYIKALLENFNKRAIDRTEANKEAKQVSEDDNVRESSEQPCNIDKLASSIDRGIVVGIDNDFSTLSVSHDVVNKKPSNKWEYVNSQDSDFAENNHVLEGSKNLTIDDEKPKAEPKALKILFLSRIHTKNKKNTPKFAPYTLPKGVYYEQESLSRVHDTKNSHTEVPTKLKDAFNKLQSSSQQSLNDIDYLDTVKELIDDKCANLSAPQQTCNEPTYSEYTQYQSQNTLEESNPLKELIEQIEGKDFLNYEENLDEIETFMDQPIPGEEISMYKSQEPINSFKNCNYSGNVEQDFASFSENLNQPTTPYFAEGLNPISEPHKSICTMTLTVSDLSPSHLNDNTKMELCQESPHSITEEFYPELINNSNNVFNQPTTSYFAEGLNPISEPQKSICTTTQSDFNLSQCSPLSLSSELKLCHASPNSLVDGMKDCQELERSEPKTMKEFKDLQNAMALKFSKLDCCQDDMKSDRRSGKEIFKAYFQKLPKAEQSELHDKMLELHLRHAYIVLRKILLDLKYGNSREAFNICYFYLICEEVLKQKPKRLASKYGLGLLKAAALQCPARPLLTRYVVQCIRAALGSDRSLYLGKEFIYDEDDPLGDNLLIACARKGDECAAVLTEIVKKYHDQPPLFSVNHINSNGHTCLHVACGEAAQARVTVHVLLKHAQADPKKMDSNGDTSVHLAVKSATCDLHMILILFKHIDRDRWHEMVHLPNNSEMTPLKIAREASKKTTRTNYPKTVPEFLKRCRKKN